MMALCLLSIGGIVALALLVLWNWARNRVKPDDDRMWCGCMYHRWSGMTHTTHHRVGSDGIPERVRYCENRALYEVTRYTKAPPRKCPDFMGEEAGQRHG